MRALLFALIVASGACIAEEPDNGNGGGADAGPIEADADEEEGVRLSVDGLPPQTYWDTVPLFVHGPANGTVLVQGPTETVSEEFGADGTTCIDIPLDKGVINDLTIVAIDALGERSEEQYFEISQAGEPPEPGEPVPARNIALGGLPIPGSLDEEEGTYPSMTDGNRNSGVIIQNNVFSSDWITVRMPTPDGVETIRIYGDEDCLMGDYLVHTAPSVQTDMPSPGGLSMDVEPWTFRGRFGSANGTNDSNVTDCSEGNIPCQEFNFDADVTGAIGIHFVGDVCDNFAGLGEHQINEIEAWTPVGVAPPILTAPSCSGGG